MQEKKKAEDNEREKLFYVKRKKCLQKELDRPDIVRDVRLREEVVAKSDSCLQSASDLRQPFPYRIGEELPTKRPPCPTIATAQ
jgi:hypothetical protein